MKIKTFFLATQVEEDRHESNLEFSDFGQNDHQLNPEVETSLEKWSSSRLIVSLWRAKPLAQLV